MNIAEVKNYLLEAFRKHKSVLDVDFGNISDMDVSGDHMYPYVFLETDGVLITPTSSDVTYSGMAFQVVSQHIDSDKEDAIQRAAEVEPIVYELLEYFRTHNGDPVVTPVGDIAYLTQHTDSIVSGFRVEIEVRTGICPNDYKQNMRL